MGNFAQAYLELTKPILFNTLMVQAILKNRKTQTRRVIKFQNKCVYSIEQIGENEYEATWGQCGGGMCIDGYEIVKPRYQVGDTLWVRETWQQLPSGFNEMPPENIYIYKATDELSDECTRWRPSIFMPKVAARLFLEVLDVRIERLQDISEKDVFEEGCRIGKTIKWDDLIPDLRTMNKELMFIPLWDSINKKRGYAYELNPFVWVYEFKKVGGYKINVKWGDVDG